MRSEQECLQELVADLAEAIQAGAGEDYPEGEDYTAHIPRFSCEVVDFNRVVVTDSDGREYVVIVKEKGKE